MDEDHGSPEPVETEVEPLTPGVDLLLGHGGAPDLVAPLPTAIPVGQEPLPLTTPPVGPGFTPCRLSVSPVSRFLRSDGKRPRRPTYCVRGSPPTPS